MKKYLFSGLALTVGLLCSCSSDPDPVPEDLGVLVNFQPTLLNVDTQPITKGTASGAAIGEVVNTIGYLFYYGSGDFYKKGEKSFDPDTQTAPEGFGTFQEIMLPGSYQTLFYAFGKGKGYGSITGDLKTYNSSIKINTNDKEVFTYNVSTKIVADKQTVSIPMERKSALLVVDIQDNVIDEAAKIEYTFNYPTSWVVTGERYEDYQKIIANPTISNKKVERYEYYGVCFKNTETLLTITIYDKSGNALGEQSLVIPMEPNRKTIVSGELFSTLGQKDLTVQISDNWGEDIQVPL